MPYEGTVPGPAADDAGVRRLLSALRALALARRRSSARDADAEARYPVQWLADLPGEVYVETDAAEGDVIFSVPVIPLTPPAVLEEFDGWLSMRHWYRALRDMAERAADQGDEIVLATGLLAWRPPEGPAVRDHLLSTPVRLVIDERSGRLDVLLAGRTVPREREVLAGLPVAREGLTDWVWDALQAGQGFGLHASVSDVLRKWCAVALGEGSDAIAYREDWVPVPAGPLPAVPQLRLAPALVARPAGETTVAGHYERLAVLLDEGPVPSGLAAFAAPKGRSPVLHVEEAGPGTVAELITGMLAQGRRVLVAAHDGASAAELRAMLPEGIAGLCAAVTGSAASARVAAELLERAAAHDPSRHREHLAELAAEEAAARTAAAELRERLARSEDGDVHDLGAAYQGPRAALEARLRAEAAEFDWLPPRPGLPEEPPISGGEAAELVRLLAEETPDRRARASQRDVDPAALPSPPYIRTLVEAEATAAARAERTGTELSRRLRRCDVRLLARLDACAGTVNATLHELGLDGHPGGWDQADHAVRAFTDALARRRPAVWERVAEMTAQARWAARTLREQARHRVELPPGEHDLRRLADAVRRLGHHLDEGGTWKRGPLRSATQRQAEPLLQGITVDGRPPTTAAALGVLFSDIMVRIACQELQYVWEAAGVSFPSDLPLEERIARFVRAHARLARIRETLPAIEETAELLGRSGLGVQLAHPVQWHGYAAGLESAVLALEVDRAAADLAALRDSIGAGRQDAHDGLHDPPELRTALAAIDARDVDAYGRCLRDLAEARHERALQLRCEGLLVLVRAAHPVLADLLAATAGEPPWPSRAEHWDEAWAWARASARLGELPRSSAETRLRADLDQASARLEEATARLAAARAWGAALSRLTPGLAVPAEVVPAWIVPLWRIPDVLPQRPDAFDVVIVDGDRGAGAEALFILWQARRVILAGRRGPELPAPEGPLPDHLGFSPTATLFGALIDRFGPDRPRPSGPAPALAPPPGAASVSPPETVPALAPAREPAPLPVRDHPPAPAPAHVQGPAPTREPEPVRERPPLQDPAPGQQPGRVQEPTRGQEPERVREGAPGRERVRVQERPSLHEPAAVRGLASGQERPPVQRSAHLPEAESVQGGGAGQGGSPVWESASGLEREALPAVLTPGRSIATYKRAELVAFVRRAAESEPGLTDDQLVELVCRLLACPADEELLAGARVRFAVDLYRGRE